MDEKLQFTTYLGMVDDTAGSQIAPGRGCRSSGLLSALSRQCRGSGGNAQPTSQAWAASGLWGRGGGRLYLGHACLGCFLFQEGQDRLHMALSGRNVQGCVAGGGGQVGIGVIFQQELHHACVANASCTVKWGLVILEPKVKTENREGFLIQLLTIQRRKVRPREGK